MKKLPLLALALALAAGASAQTIRIVNGASLAAGGIAPGSIVTIFGTNLASAAASASSAQTPPTTLGGITVSIGGSPAALFYVSPTQINAVVNASTPNGTQTVTVTTPTGIYTTTVTIDPNAAPGLFSLQGTGTGDGAIINAITYLLGSFSTRTGAAQTYLSLFATGLNTATAPTVTIAGVLVTVSFYGPSPCCAGLQQVNVAVPDSLAGAGRVPVVLTSNGRASNVVEIVLLPASGQGTFPTDQDNQTRNRELASLAYVPGTSLVLSTDENDDVVRVIDVKARQVLRVLALPEDARPSGIAVNAAGTIAVVAERGTGRVAILDLVKNTVIVQVAADAGTSAVAIAGTQAIAVNTDAGTVTLIDLIANAFQKNIPVGRAPHDVAVDETTRKAYVVNQNDGTISVVDLASQAVSTTINLGATVRPQAIALVPATTMALVTAPSSGPDGQVLLVNLVTSAVSTLNANPDRSGGSGDVVVFGSKAFFANQASGTVAVLPLDAYGSAAGALTTLKADLGVRALAIDAKDNLLVTSNQGSGTLVVMDLATNTVVGRINAVRSSSGDNQDDRSDRNSAANIPTITSIAPATAKAGSSITTFTVNGTNLTGATDVVFVDPSNTPGNDKGKGEGKGKGLVNQTDNTIKTTNVKVNAGGTQLTATVTLANGSKAGERLVRVVAPNGESTTELSSSNTFRVTQ